MSDILEVCISNTLDILIGVRISYILDILGVHISDILDILGVLISDPPPLSASCPVHSVANAKMFMKGEDVSGQRYSTY